MAKKFLVSIDLNKNELQNARLQNLGSAPSTPVEGQLYWDTVGHRFYGYNANAAAWQNKATDSDLLGGQNSAYHLARANHSGTQLASTISDFDTQVRTSRLDQMAAPTASVSLNSQKITNLLSGTASTDAINKGQLDAAIQGISAKYIAACATAAALPACTYANGSSGVGATLTGNSNGALTVDTLAVTAGDLVLVKNQVTAANNGLYVVTQAGSGGTPFILTRHTSMDQSTEFQALIAVEDAGGTNDNTLWLCVVAQTITVGTTAVDFVQLNSAVSLSEGNGINISGYTISVDYGTGLTLSGATLIIDTAVVVRKYAVDVGDNASTSITVTHNLGTRDVQVSLYQATSTYDEVECDVLHATTNTVTLVFATAPTTNQFRCVVQA